MIRTNVVGDNNRLFTYGFVSPLVGVQQGRAIDCHAEGLNNRKGRDSRTIAIASSLTAGESTVLDVYSWLPAAAEEMNLSPDIKDYVIVPNVPTIISDIPNTNGVAFPRKQLLRYSVSAGRMAYKSWTGKPTYLEHDNADHTKAKGVIFDCYASPLEGYGRDLIKIVKLLAFDRTRDPQLCNEILSGKRNCYSMGASFKGFHMSDGSRPTKKALETPLYRNARGQLVYCNVEDIEGFETSSVAVPAFVSALSNKVVTL